MSRSSIIAESTSPSSSSSPSLASLSPAPNDNNNARSVEDEKRELIGQLKNLVERCETRFCNRYELATECDEIVRKLCACLERAFSHRLNTATKHSRNKTSKIINGLIPSSAASSSSDSPSSNNRNTSNNNNSQKLQFWNFISCYLTEHEVKRFTSLRNVHTDYGRGRSWLRNALNEHSLERYILIIFEDRANQRKRYFHESALLADDNRCLALISATQGLAAVLFALNIDDPALDYCEPEGDSNSRLTPNSVDRLAPVLQATEIIGASLDTSQSNNNNVIQNKRKTKKSTNFITIGGDDQEDADQNISYNDNDNDNQPSNDIYARSAPAASFLDPRSAILSSPNDSLLSIPAAATGSPNQLDEKPLFPSRSASRLRAPEEDNDILDNNMVLYPIYDDNDGQKHQQQQQPQRLKVQASGSSKKFGTSPPSATTTGSDKSSIKTLYDRISMLERENDRFARDNSLLKIQLNKYCAALELLKYRNATSDSGRSSGRGGVEEEEGGRGLDDSTTNAESHLLLSESRRDAAHYERKLVQVSEMHGELVEFNEHLYRVIQQKESIISRLRDELIELRGPLPESDEIMSIASTDQQDAHSSSASHQFLAAPLIHVWIPTAFLSGGFHGKSHHIYQIYIRIKEEEWNVYRRYSQFYALHRSLKAENRSVAQFEFPPKKAIGNKDSRVVQERRKKLEHYLRCVINLTRARTDLSNKDKLVTAIPFLSDKFFLQDQQRSRSETNLFSASNASNTQQQQSQGQMIGRQQLLEAPASQQHYMGF